MPTTQVKPTDPSPRPWNVAPRAGFAVDDARGEVALVQTSKSEFRVLTPFRFTGDKIREDLRIQLAKDGITGSTATGMIEKACTFEIDPDPGKNNTDLASIPQFMRWFENPYGCHTLAAILHDQLIGKEPNDGALRSDTLADRFFRHLLEAAGVRPFKAMILWTADGHPQPVGRGRTAQGEARPLGRTGRPRARCPRQRPVPPIVVVRRGRQLVAGRRPHRAVAGLPVAVGQAVRGGLRRRHRPALDRARGRPGAGRDPRPQAVRGRRRPHPLGRTLAGATPGLPASRPPAARTDSW